ARAAPGRRQEGSEQAMTQAPTATIDWSAIATRATEQAVLDRLVGRGDAARLAEHLRALQLDEVPTYVGDVVLAFAAACADPLAQTELHNRVVNAARSTLPAAGYADHVVEDATGELMLTLLQHANKRSP